MSEDQAKMFAVLNTYRDITMPTHGYPDRCQGNRINQNYAVAHVAAYASLHSCRAPIHEDFFKQPA